MNKYHREILAEIRKAAGAPMKTIGDFKPSRYFGTNKPFYHLKSAKGKEIAKKWIKKHPALMVKEFVEVLNSLYQGKSHNERTFGGRLLEYLPKLRKQIDPTNIDRWLTGAEGWAEVDSLCQSCFGTDEVLGNWLKWKKLLDGLVKDKDVQKRRASLVLLVKTAGKSKEKKLAGYAFDKIDKLKSERDVLITKAISWLLRALTYNHRKDVQDYLAKNVGLLPAIAIRETKNKLETGKKQL